MTVYAPPVPSGHFPEYPDFVRYRATVVSGKPSEQLLHGIETRIRAIAEQCVDEADLLIALRHVRDANTAELGGDRLRLRAAERPA